MEHASINQQSISTLLPFFSSFPQVLHLWPRAFICHPAQINCTHVTAPAWLFLFSQHHIQQNLCPKSFPLGLWDPILSKTLTYEQLLSTDYTDQNQGCPLRGFLSGQPLLPTVSSRPAPSFPKEIYIAHTMKTDIKSQSIILPTSTSHLLLQLFLLLSGCSKIRF